MKVWLTKATVLTVIGIVFYKLAMASGGPVYHFPWEIFAALGMAGYVLKEIAKLFRQREKR